MKTPVVDYRRFRLRRLNDPEFEHIRLLTGWILYFALYFLTENLIPVERCHVVHSALDDMIPFHEGFLLGYCYWYVLLAGTLLYYFLYDIPRFKRMQTYVMIAHFIAMAIYILWPSVQQLRPAEFERDNLLTRVMGLIYQFDTPTGVCPSLHVADAIAIAAAWLRTDYARRGWKACMVASAVLIALSTAFVKQHSTVDIFAALPLCALCDALVYGGFGGSAGRRLRAYLAKGPSARDRATN